MPIRSPRLNDFLRLWKRDRSVSFPTVPIGVQERSMATEKEEPRSLAASVVDRREALTCSLCMDIFMCPKLLPCAHTFCLACLEKLLPQYQSSVFPCPVCRRGIMKPPGGANAFQTNFYIQPEDLDKARDGTQCLNHPTEDLDLFCADCFIPVCLKCKMTKHDSHKALELSEAVDAAKIQLGLDQTRLQQALTSTLETLELTQKKQVEMLERRSAMESIIRKHHNTLVAAADKFLVESLAILKISNQTVEKKLNDIVHEKQEALEDLDQLQRKLKDAQSARNRYQLLSVVQEMREGRGSPEILDQFTFSENSKDVSRSRFEPDFIRIQFRQFQDTVSAVDKELKSCSSACLDKYVPRAKHIRVTVSAQRQFICGDSLDTEVFFLCPLDDGSVWLSYVKHGGRKNAPSERYDSKGKLVQRREGLAGKVSFKCLGDEKIQYALPAGDEPQPYSKTGSMVYFKLSQSKDGRANIAKVKVALKEPYQAEISTECTINVGPHRAFDMGGQEQFIVVLEEPQSPATRRVVKMYSREKPDPLAVYVPPTPTCQPSDVCFCRLGGQDAVLVADEMGDCIHVIGLNDGAMTFLRYLAPGCPGLLQPTALNTDAQGRLWVACRGGLILTMSPVSWAGVPQTADLSKGGSEQ